jgi:hypothetical protein
VCSSQKVLLTLVFYHFFSKKRQDEI